MNIPHLTPEYGNTTGGQTDTFGLPTGFELFNNRAGNSVSIVPSSPELYTPNTIQGPMGYDVETNSYPGEILVKIPILNRFDEFSIRDINIYYSNDTTCDFESQTFDCTNPCPESSEGNPVADELVGFCLGTIGGVYLNNYAKCGCGNWENASLPTYECGDGLLYCNDLCIADEESHKLQSSVCDTDFYCFSDNLCYSEYQYFYNPDPEGYPLVSPLFVDPIYSDSKVTESDNQNWLGGYYYPVLPKINKAGKFDEDRLGLQSTPGFGINKPFGSNNIKWDEDDTFSPITMHILPNKWLDYSLIDIDFSEIESQISDTTLKDNSPISNYGLLIDDYKIDYKENLETDKKGLELEQGKPSIKTKLGKDKKGQAY